MMAIRRVLRRVFETARVWKMPPACGSMTVAALLAGALLAGPALSGEFALAGHAGQERSGTERSGQEAAKAADIHLAGDVRRWVKQLDSAELAEREAAEKSLIDAGPAVLSHLPQVTDRTAAEVKLRLERVVQTLEKTLAAGTALPSKVKLDGQLTLEEAVQAIRRQTGNRIVGGLGENRSLQWDKQQGEFWPVLDRLLDRAGMAIEPYGGTDHALTLVQRSEGQANRFGLAVYRGPFRFEAIRIRATRDLRTPEVRGLRVTMEVSWEPRLAPVSIGLPLDAIQATDEKGNSLSVANSQATPRFPVQPGVSTVEIDIPFQLPPRQANQLDRLAGNCLISLPGRVETFEFPPLGGAGETRLRKAGASVVLEGVRKNQALYEVRMRVEFDDAGNALESHRGWVFNNKEFLLDKQGKEIAPLTQQTTRQERNGVGLAYLFDLSQPLKNYHFVYKTPALMLRRTVAFELRDIELP